MTVLAYYDCFSGLLPCTALSINPDNMITLRVNATRGAYHKGEIIVGSRLHTFPRAHFHKSRRGPFHFYTTSYRWEDLLQC